MAGNENTESIGDWRDRGRYQALASLDCAGWVWEFLRRNPAYGAQAAQAQMVRTATLPEAPSICVLTLDGTAGIAADWGLQFCRRRSQASHHRLCLLACRL